MKAPITFFIGLGVAVLSIVQLVLMPSPVRWVGLAIGVFFMIFGGVVGWTRHRGFTVALGHFALTAGLLVSAWAFYQLPFLKVAPTFIEVLDLPLFWGLFTTAGGFCMINHGTCACCIRQHEARRSRTAKP